MVINLLLWNWGLGVYDMDIEIIRQSLFGKNDSSEAKSEPKVKVPRQDSNLRRMV